jgi:hypothetical protein
LMWIYWLWLRLTTYEPSSGKISFPAAFFIKILIDRTKISFQIIINMIGDLMLSNIN